MSVLNSTILERAYISGSNDYQQRVGNPAIQGYSNCVEHLFDPMNADMFNEFSKLLNGIIATHVDVRRFENPMDLIKKPTADWRFGTSERHLAVKYMQGHSPRFDDQTLLRVEKPEYVEWFYSLNYENRYEFSWSRYEMKQAFSNDGYGFDELLAATITQMLSSAAYDEMNTMLQTFAEADKRTNGLFRYHLSAEPDDEATAKELLKGIRATAGRMRFPSTRYNQLPVPVHTDGSRLVLYVLPEVMASIDVDALSAVFQLPKADPNEVLYRIIPVPEFPMPNVCAILADEDFIFWRDYMTGMEPPFYNPGNRTLKYYYYASAAVGFNPAAPCCVFTTEEATVIPTVTVEPNGLAFEPGTYEVAAGRSVQLNLNLTGSVDGDTSGVIGVEPDAGMYTVAATRGGEAVPLNSRTYVDNYGKLHVQKTGVEVGDVFTVNAKSSYINPSGETRTFEATATVTIVAPENFTAKECPVAKEPYIEYTNVTEDVTASE